MSRKLLFDDLKQSVGKSIVFSKSVQQLDLDLSASFICEEAIEKFEAYSKKLQLVEAYKTSLVDNQLNCFEQRSVNHHQLRELNTGYYLEQHQALMTFTQAVFNRTHPDFKDITDVVQIGIGGSYLGPLCVYNAFCDYSTQHNITQRCKAHFVANLDPWELQTVLKELDIKRTLFIIVSKSGSTMETQVNVELLEEYIKDYSMSQQDLAGQCVAVTMKGSLLDTDDVAKYRFYIDETIGGRFSVTSPIATCLLGICFGQDCVEQFLQGALLMDQNAAESNFLNNLSLLSAWEVVWQHTVCGYSTRVVACYSHALRYFSNYLQQLGCESNGKSVDRKRRFVDYSTSPLIVPAVGTNDQHSFFQLLHQGTAVFPVEFLGVKQLVGHLAIQQAANKKLNANLKAQIEALKEGCVDDDPNKVFFGKRPSSLLMLDFLTPSSIGQLVAFYENRVMFEGFILNINSFDQEGVQLGKVLTNKLLQE